jgi:hypothetical protein
MLVTGSMVEAQQPLHEPTGDSGWNSPQRNRAQLRNCRLGQHCFRNSLLARMKRRMLCPFGNKTIKSMGGKKSCPASMTNRAARFWWVR